MSFSQDVKKELAGVLPKARHCALAELDALVLFAGEGKTLADGSQVLRLNTENRHVAIKFFTLLRKTFNIRADVVVRRSSKTGAISYGLLAKSPELIAVRKASLQAGCCKRAFIRGAYLASGSISDPNKSYHFEVVCETPEIATRLQKAINSFEMDGKIVERKGSYVVYLKEGAQIVDMLGVMEGHISLMALENVRILKEMRNTVNRKVNCETANLSKTVSAAVRQMEDIRFLEERLGIDNLPEGLREIAAVRLEYPEASLKELGEMLAEPLGKSGVNHRLRKISELADKMRKS
ncbi:DNA-binding protein WhiA [Lachnospiraceae bacterium PF1-21]|uniref:DNA-binding protein WhiA n=1 Tax=Ohessyouella blattaphilus TaxID=2949333 RepID=UPI00255FD40D|nr:DNA-binding protein WhiA [Lachnospiraceae bacterium OttesenSCG-928-J05]